MVKSKTLHLSYDMRPPPPSSNATINVMKANVAKDTGPELLMRKALRDLGLPGYRLNWKGVPGRPDITYPGRKVAIFVHGCYWHRCPHCDYSIPKSNRKYWIWKFERNRERDGRKIAELERAGWKTFVFWECQIKDDANECSKIVKRHIKGLKNKS